MGAWSALLAGALATLAVGGAALGLPRPVAPLRRPSPPVPVTSSPVPAPDWATHLGRRLRLGLDGGQARRLLAAIGATACVALLIAPGIAPLVLAGGWLGMRRAEQSARRRQRSQTTAALPDLVDLLLLCTSAGLSLPVAQPLVARRSAGELGRALQAADDAAGAGRPRADCLTEALTALGDRPARLAHVVVDHLRYGVPLAPGLERLSVELKLDRRRRAEEEARRVPVRLLGPLVACVLPAFGLLTVVPLLAASLRALPT